MNANIFRCGWCGMPTQSNGLVLRDGAFKKAVHIIETYGDYRTIKVNGECCAHEANF